jgi:hypothetical protein
MDLDTIEKNILEENSIINKAKKEKKNIKKNFFIII